VQRRRTRQRKDDLKLPLTIPGGIWGLARARIGALIHTTIRFVDRLVWGGTMQEFDPRRPQMRYAPRLLVCAAGCAALAVGWRITSADDHAAPRPLDPAAVAALEHQAFAQAEAQPGFTRPEKVAIRVLPGETFEGAVRRVGVAPAEAQQIVHAIGAAFDTVNIKAGLVIEAAVAKPRDLRGPVRLIGLSMKTGPASALTLSRTFDGALRLRELQEQVRDEETVAQGSMSDSLYASAMKAGATPELTAEVVKLFSHKLDFSRDIHAGDQFRMVFERKVSESGRTVEAGDLLYAEIGAKGQVTRFYRFQQPGAAEPQYFDEFGKNIRGFLLRTPVDGARVTSGFGMRFHPILGYTRMHQGIDFGVPVGTPVYAAGDGVVEEARMAHGYGRWLKIKHSGGWETGYGHLSGWAVRAGQHVRQGQVVAYSGNTGASTGPHLHYEVMEGGHKMNPKGAKVPQGSILSGRELAAFKLEQAHIEGVLMAAAGRTGAPTRLAMRDDAQGRAPINSKRAGLR
jgi:murein DD-endopeptidase MepM/ murein hydrolase activator NlpD